MVSSTFADLEAHRRDAIEAIGRFGFFPNVMEHSGARSDADVIDTSLRMVRESFAYLCVIGHTYGQTPADPARNPKGLSITELEFNEARRLGRPILLFLMADDHPVTKSDIEPDTKKRKKLDAFRQQAKRVAPGAAAERVYDTFASKGEFAKKAAIAVGLEAIRAIGKPDLPDRAIRDAIARFIGVKPEANQAELTDAIQRFETDYRALKGELAAIAVTDNRVVSLKIAAEAALAEGDLDKARAAYREAADAALDKAAEPARIAAELKSAEAGAHLLALDWEAADAAWGMAAAMLAPFDAEAAEDVTEDAARRLSMHGERYAIAGALIAAIARWRDLAASAEARGDAVEVARLRHGLGSALTTQGERTGGPIGLRILEEAAAVLREALAVRTVAQSPVQWAATQNNLGLALQSQGDRANGHDSLRLFEEAANAFRAALTIHTRAEMPFLWATTQNNLANALARQGERSSSPEDLRLLELAVAAYREALTVRTRADRPHEWAMTQNNLGNAIASRGERTGGSDGFRLLGEAVTAFSHASTIRTCAEMPADWAMTQENLALTFESMAAADPEGARAHLLAAEAAFVAALGVYTPEHMSFYHDKATRSLARVRAKLAALDG